MILAKAVTSFLLPDTNMSIMTEKGMIFGLILVMCWIRVDVCGYNFAVCAQHSGRQFRAASVVAIRHEERQVYRRSVLCIANLEALPSRLNVQSG